jgi:hypothetical protein
MNLFCKLKHPFEIGLDTFLTTRRGHGFLLLRCKHCDYVYDSDKTGKPNLDWLMRDKNQWSS